MNRSYTQPVDDTPPALEHMIASVHVVANGKLGTTNPWREHTTAGRSIIVCGCGLVPVSVVTRVCSRTSSGANPRVNREAVSAFVMQDGSTCFREALSW